MNKLERDFPKGTFVLKKKQYKGCSEIPKGMEKYVALVKEVFPEAKVVAVKKGES